MQAKKFKINDKVSVIDDTIQGKIIAINKETVQIEDENGFIFTYNEQELVLANDLYTNIKVANKDKKTVKKAKHTITVKKLTILKVDLHIHQITKSNKYLSNADMLKRQLNHAELKLKHAISKRIPKVFLFME